MPAALGKVWLAIALLLGLVFVLAMTRVYQIDTVPTWYTGYTTSAFFLTVLLSGPLFAALLLRMAKVDVNVWFIAGLSVAALVISAAIIVMQSAGLGAIHSAVQQAATLLPDYGRLQALRLILLALGLGCWLCPLIRRQPPRCGAVGRSVAGPDRGMYWPRPVLWAPYDRRYGGCPLMRRRAGAPQKGISDDAVPSPRRCRLKRPYLGALFSYAPNSPQIAPLVAAFGTAAGSSSGPSGCRPAGIGVCRVG